MKKVGLCLIVLAAFALCGCKAGSYGGLGGQGNVGIVDNSARVHHETRLTGTDFVQFAEKVTDKMLASGIVSSWGGKRPKLVLGHVRNSTDDENLRITDIYDRIQEVLMNSGAVRIVDKSSTSFDYIMKNTITSTQQRNPQTGEEIVNYTLMLKLFKIDGELVGQWSDDLVLGKGQKSLF
ncbi:MAG: hypothetical protein ACNI27_06535 [Desulfovibrio sp.]